MSKKTLIQKVIPVRCVQHPNGDAWITADDSIPDHFKVLATKYIDVEFKVDLGHDPNRAHPDGRAT